MIRIDEPDSWFSQRVRTSIKGRWIRKVVDVIRIYEPESWFPERLRNVKAVRFPISGGMLPGKKTTINTTKMCVLVGIRKPIKILR